MGTATPWTIPWHGKLNHEENVCPHCLACDQFSEVSKEVYELSARSYKLCINCKGKFVDTYLINFGEDYESEDNWMKQRDFEKRGECHADMFNHLESQGWLEYDEHNPDEDKDYYDIKPQSIHFIKGE